MLTEIFQGLEQYKKCSDGTDYKNLWIVYSKNDFTPHSPNSNSIPGICQSGVETLVKSISSKLKRLGAQYFEDGFEYRDLSN